MRTSPRSPEQGGEMTTERAQWGKSVERSLNGRESAAIDELNQRAIRRAESAPERAPAPLEFDARGFPIPQPLPGFMQRVGRLIHGS
jgi:hypothetical protein